MNPDQFKINGTILTFGEGWEVVAPGDFKRRQKFTIDDLGIAAKVVNTRSGYIAGPVHRNDGGADVYSVGPTGDILAVVHVSAGGGKYRMAA